MKRVLMLAVMAISLATASQVQACGGCCGGFAFLGGGSCNHSKAARPAAVVAAHPAIAPLAVGYAEFQQTKWKLMGAGLEKGLVGLASR